MSPRFWTARSYHESWPIAPSAFLPRGLHRSVLWISRAHRLRPIANAARPSPRAHNLNGRGAEHCSGLADEGRVGADELSRRHHNAKRFFRELIGPGIFDPLWRLVSGKIYAWKGGFAVKQKRFNVEQIVAVLKQAEAGVPLAELIRRVGISEQTFYRWKKQYVGLEVDQVRQLKQLQEENARLKRLVADLTLDKAMLQDVLSKKF
jgi:putative transposase